MGRARSTQLLSVSGSSSSYPRKPSGIDGIGAVAHRRRPCSSRRPWDSLEAASSSRRPFPRRWRTPSRRPRRPRFRSWRRPSPTRRWLDRLRFHRARTWRCLRQRRSVSRGKASSLTPTQSSVGRWKRTSLSDALGSSASSKSPSALACCSACSQESCLRYRTKGRNPPAPRATKSAPARRSLRRASSRSTQSRAARRVASLR